MSRIVCWICYRAAGRNLKAVVRHMAAVHAHDPSFFVCCGVEECSRTYTNFYSFKKHLYRKHRFSLEMTAVSSPLEVPNNSEGDICNEDHSDESNELSKFEYMKQMSLFLLKTKELRKVSQEALNGIVHDFTSMLQMTISQTKYEVEGVLKGRGISMSAFPDLEHVFDDPHRNQPFKGLDSKHLQESFYRDHLNILEPVEVKMGQRMILQRRVSQPYLKIVHDCIYYIPFLESLHRLLSDNLVFEEVMRGHRRSDGNLSDYCDGSDFKKHPLYSSDPKALQIMLYFDEVEVCNPLGTKDGITVVSEGESQTFWGTISLVSGDNLASHYLGGNKAPSGSLRKCRHCMATSDEMQTQFVAGSFQSRSRETHAHHCSLLNGPLHNHAATAYGIERDSILNTSKYFHVVEGMVPDIMHDVLEGCTPYEVKELMKYLHGESLVTLRYLNEQIQHFPYAPCDVRNKPTPIPESTFKSTDHSVKQKAGQMWCLARLLPLMIGEKIPENDEKWKNFLLLLDIMDYVFAPVLSQNHVAYLHQIIEDHHEMFVKLYPTCNITPKLHYMVHYPQWIARCGPLCRFFCMRYESKNGYFKDIAHRVYCFKNIPLTLASHHQRLSCLLANEGSKSCLIKDTITGPEIDVDKPYNYENLQVYFPQNSSITRVRWIEVLGTRYTPGGVVVLSVDCVPVFGLICEILMSDVNNYFLVCENLTTDFFHHHYHAYRVMRESRPSYSVVKQHDLVDHTVLGLYKSQYIVLKYHVM